jgi:hypothetical protein
VSKVTSTHKPIGLLYDAISHNAGDIAIGIAVSQVLTEMRVKHEVVDPFNYEPNDYEFLVVGGGFLLRDPGDYYYDNFRPEGRHFLNAMGGSTSQSLSYLKNYRSVTVRSEADKSRLLSGEPALGVEVLPDTTILMEPNNRKQELARNKVGLQFVADTLNDCPGFEDVVNEIQHPKVTFPFTFYNHDLSLMSKANLVGDYTYLEEYDPQTQMGFIGGMKYAIVSSLHATIFAYTQNTPFLTFYQSKVHDFLVDRGLEGLIFHDAKELGEKIKMIESNPPDFQKLVEIDKSKIRKHFEKIFSDYKASASQTILINKKPLVRHEELSETMQATKHNLILLSNVIAHRDKLIQTLIQRSVHIKEKLNATEQRVAGQDGEIERLSTELYKYESNVFIRSLRKIKRLFIRK